MLPSDIRFKANPAERWLPPGAALFLAEPRRYIAFFAVGLVYAISLAFLIFDDKSQPAVVNAPEAIPIEIVVEPPPQKKPDSPAANPEPQPQAPPILEEPATDAPRAANNEKLETEAPDAAPKPAPAPPPPTPEPEKAAEPTRQGELQPKDNSAEPVLDKPADEARPAPTPAPDPAKPDQQQARAETEAKTEKPKTSADFQLPTFESVPDVDFGAAAKQTPVAGGNAKATYLSILYGMIIPHMRSPTGARPKSGKLEGTIVFGVDGRGNLTERRIVHQSGSRDLDAAALEAIAQAAPFPAPPKGIPLGLRFTYGAE